MEATRVGESVGHFRVLAKLGQGGMGIVYKAEDERLGRVVALKVLPPEAIGNPERRARFLREARSAAAVTHPAIATIFEVAEDGDAIFIAMEYVEGQTLRARIAGAPMPLPDALRLAIPIADALAKAHRAGVIHRDLKPDNVMVTTEGDPKILDFGLAKAPSSPTSGSASSTDPALDDTMAQVVTREGAVFGTPAYMSPEQARGLPVDRRTDLFSLGSVLHEMLSGRPPFGGPTPMDTVAAVMKEPAPRLGALVPGLPAEVETIVGRCLEKEPHRRYGDASELSADLRRLLRAVDSGMTIPTAPASTLPSAPPPRRRGRVLIFAAIAAVLATAGVVVALRRGGRTDAGAPAAPPDAGPAGRAALAPGDLRVRALTHFPPSTQVYAVELSPDGERALLATPDAWYLLTVAGGQPERLPDLRAGMLTWVDDATVLAVAGQEDGLWLERRALDGGASTRLGRIDAAVLRLSHDGKHLAYMNNAGDVVVADGDGGHARVLGSTELQRATTFGWSPDDRRLLCGGFGKDGFLLDVIDVETGRRDRLLSGQALGSDVGDVHAVWTAPDRILYATHDEQGSTLLESAYEPGRGLVGERVPRGAQTGVHVGPVDATADGSRALAISLLVEREAWIVDLDKAGAAVGSPRRLAADVAGWPSGWSSDGRSVYVSVGFRGRTMGTLMRLPAEGGAAEKLIDQLPGSARAVPGGFVYLRGGDGETKRQVVRFDEATRREEVLGTVEITAGRQAQIACAWKRPETCVLGERSKASIGFYAYDLRAGRGRAIAEVAVNDHAADWELSPDGRRLAVSDGVAPFRFVELAGGATSAAPREPDLYVQDFVWAPDGRSFVATGMRRSAGPVYRVVRIGLDGRQTALATSEEVWLYRPNVSPDGRHVLYGTHTMSMNVWLLER